MIGFAIAGSNGGRRRGGSRDAVVRRPDPTTSLDCIQPAATLALTKLPRGTTTIGWSAQRWQDDGPWAADTWRICLRPGFRRHGENRPDRVGGRSSGQDCVRGARPSGPEPDGLLDRSGPLELATAGAGLSRSEATAIRSDGRRERSASTSPYLFDPCPALSTSTDRAPALTCRRERDSIRWRACSEI